jgi:prolyl-tRNA synthetase
MVASRQARAFSNHIVRGKFATRPLTVAFSAVTDDKGQLESQIKAKGDEIRALKDGGADRAAVAPLVEELLALKAKLEPPSNKVAEPRKESGDEGDSDFITARTVDYSKWYNDIIRVTGLAENSPVRGCMVIKPWGMSLWDRVRTDLDARIQEHGAENAYFPLLIPKSFLSKEAEHVDGFAKECAVVTHHRLTAGEGGLVADPDAELEDPLIIRPTSETMIWYMFRKWINSHR